MSLVHSFNGLGIERLRLKEAVNGIKEQAAENVKYVSSLLQTCGDLHCLAEGKQIHDWIIERGLLHDRILKKKLLRMYGKCGNVNAAHSLFDSLEKPDTGSWNVVITSYAQKGHIKEAFELLDQFMQTNSQPNEFTFLGVLSACSKPEDLADGRFIHACISKFGLETGSICGPALVGMYIRCGSVFDAREVFKESSSVWDRVGWNVVMTAYAQTGLECEAFQLFRQMQLEGHMPDAISLINLLSCCNHIQEGEALHARLIAGGHMSNHMIRNATLTMYSKLGKLSEAQKIFHSGSCSRDVVTWNSMIAAYAQYGHHSEAFHLFKLMLLEGVVLDRVTFLNALSSCEQPEALPAGRIVHACATEQIDVDTDVVLSTALLNMLGKCGNLENARVIFDTMQQKNAVAWNSMISAYGQHGRWRDALQEFRLMLIEGMQPSHVTFLSVLYGFSDEEALKEAKFVHGCIVEAGYETDMVVGNALVTMYGNCKSLHNARMHFDRMPKRNVISWTALVSTYVQLEKWQEAVHSFRQMQLEGVHPNKITLTTVLTACCCSQALGEGKRLHTCIKQCGLETDPVVAASLVHMYNKCGDLQAAESAFEEILEPEVANYNVLLLAYVDHRRYKEAVRKFQIMLLKAVTPNKLTLVTLLNGCAEGADIADGKMVHQVALEAGFGNNLIVGGAIIKLYGSCGSSTEAGRIFNGMQTKDACTWNTLIAAYAQHGHANEALELFRIMQQDGILPTEVTFISVLTASSHAHLVDEAREHFHIMACDYGIAPVLKHYGCIVDLLARRGDLHDAEDLLCNMPFQPCSAEWMALLSACKIHGDILRGQRAAEHVVAIEPQAASIALSSIYADHKNEISQK